ncbi:MAG: VOC family protein [Acidobacteriota bacterium]|nr:VOC family protein [Acidobacteriota bacterium]
MAETRETYRTVTPYLVVADGDAELKFLREAFGGVEQVCHRTPEGAVMHAEVRVGDSLIMLGQAGGTSKALPAALYVWIEDVDEVYGRALAAGAASQSAPKDMPYGHRHAGVVDGNGVTWWIGAPVKAGAAPAE